jgi:serine protease Do
VTPRALALGVCVLAVSCDHRNRADGDWGTALPPGATPVISPSPEASESAPSASSARSAGGPLLVRVEPVSFAPIAHAADASVVTVTTVSAEIEVSPFSHRPRAREVGGLGTGFLVDKAGIVLTNYHVIEGASTVRVKLSDERELPGQVVATDHITDIAVVRIEAKGLRPLPLGDSDTLDVGDWVVAIGNPFGLSHTVSAGIISAKGRSLQDVQLDPSGYYDFLQTDASINPGNSGGPLLNLKGEVVGINTAIRGGGAQGIGFAIPINMVKQLLPMLLRDGHVTRSALGINIGDARELTDDDRHALGIPPNERLFGAVVMLVAPAGPADRAGLVTGDIVVGFEGQSIERSAQLQWLASTSGVGRTVKLRVRRAAKLFDLNVTLGKLAEQDQPAESAH